MLPCLPSLLLFTDRRAVPGGDLIARLSAIVEWVPAGSLAIVLAEPELAFRCKEFNASVYINDRVDLALAVGAGVHLPPGGLDPRDVRAAVGDRAPIIVSTRSSAMVARHARYADAVLFGPVLPTLGASYPLGSGPRGLEALARARNEVGPDVALYAFGGITPESAAMALEHGASGVAVMSAVLADLDPVAAAARMVRESGGKCRDPRYLDSPLAIDDHL